MDRETLRREIRETTEIEKRILRGENPRAALFEALRRDGYYREEEGFYVFPRDIQRYAITEASSFFKDGLFISSPQDQLRLVRHDRFERDPLHSYEFIQVTYVYSGTLHVHFRDREELVPQGHLCLIGEKVVHSYELPTQDDIALSIQVDPAYFTTNLLRELEPHPIVTFLVNNKKQADAYQVFDYSGDDRVHLLFRNLLLEYLSPDFCSKAIIESYFQLLSALIIRSVGEKKDDSGDFQKISQILRYIDKNFATVRLKELAEHFHYSEKHISNLIRAGTGQSFSEYVLALRLHQARDLIVSTSLPVNEIADHCGFSNHTHFYKTFQRYYGKTPLALRQEEKRPER